MLLYVVICIFVSHFVIYLNYGLKTLLLLKKKLFWLEQQKVDCRSNDKSNNKEIFKKNI
jgi:hypothetical protein